MSDKLPGYTCWEIDELQRLMRAWVKHQALPQPEAQRGLRLAESIREANIKLRAGFCRATAQATAAASTPAVVVRRRSREHLSLITAGWEEAASNVGRNLVRMRLPGSLGVTHD